MSQNIVNLLGAGSGLDTQALVTSLVDVERAAPQASIDNKRELAETQISDYGLLNSALSVLQDAADAIGDSDTFNTKSASFGDSSAFLPVALEPEAQTGSYSFSVSQLAQAQSLSSGATFADPGDTIGEGVLTFSFGNWDAVSPPANPTSFTQNEASASQTITIDSSNNTLTGLANTINEADFGVQASIVNDGTAFRLVLLADSGLNNQIQIDASDTDGNNTDASGLSNFAFNDTSFNMAQNQVGQDAALTVNGLAVTRESNTIDDLVEGFEFTIAGVTTENISVSIEDDKVVAEQTVRDFVEAYNLFLETIEPIVGFNEELNDFGSLNGDSIAKNIPSQIRSLLVSDVVGLDDTFTALTNVGIRTERDGSFSIDESTFTDAVNDNYDLFKNLFIPSTNTSNEQISINTFGDNTQSGSYDVVITTPPQKGTFEGAAAAGGIIAGLAADVPTSASLSGAANTALLTDFIESQGQFVASTASAPLDLSAAGANDYDFSIVVDGIAAAADISLPPANYASFDDMATALETAINDDANLSGVTVSFDNGQFTFSSPSTGANSSVELTAVSPNANTLGIGGGTASNGSGGANDYDFSIAVDGTTSGTISLTPDTYESFDDLAAHIQEQINADANISGAGAAVTVTHNGASFIVQSNSTGVSSTIDNATAIGPQAASLGLTTGTATQGAATGGNTSAYDFTVELNGTTSGTISLDSGTYADLDAVAAEIQSQINTDPAIVEGGGQVTVEYDAETGGFNMVSNRFGASSNISFNDIGANAADLGLSTGVGSAGVNVVGTVDGVAAFGTGNVLLPALGEPGESLSLIIGENATTATVNLSRGFGNQLALLIEDFLGNNGAINLRETSLDEDLTDLDTDQEDLDRRIDAYQERLTAQFIAMEAIVRSLQDSGSFLESTLGSLLDSFTNNN